MAVKEALVYTIGADDKDLQATLKRTSDAVRKSTDEAKKAADATAAHDARRARVAAAFIANLEREIALSTRKTRAAQAEWDIEHGKYRDLDAQSKARLLQLAREADQQAALAEAAKRTARENERAAVEAARLADKTAAERFSGSRFKRSLSGLEGTVGQVTNSALGLAAAFGNVGSAASGAGLLIAGTLGGGIVGAALAGLAASIQFVTRRTQEKKQAQEEAARAVQESAAQAVKGLEQEREALGKVLARVRALNEARRTGASEEAASRSLQLKELARSVPNRQAEAAAALARREAVAKRLGEERELLKRAQEEVLRNEMRSNRDAIDVIGRARVKGHEKAIAEILKEYDTALQAETSAFNAAEEAKTAKARLEAEQRIDDELERQRRRDQALRDRQSARDSLVQLDVEERAIALEEQGISAAEARAQAEIEFADKLIKTNDARARALELEVLYRNLEKAVRDEERARVVAREQLATSTIDGLERELQLIGLSTNAERARFEVEQGRYKDLDAASKARIVQLSEEKDRTEALAEAAKRAESERLAFEGELQSLRQAAMTQDEKRIADVARWDAALAAGTVTAEAHAEAVRLINDAFEAAGQTATQTNDIIAEQWKQLEALGKNVAQSFTDTFVDAFFDPQKKSWSEWLTEVSKQIAKAMLQMLALKAVSAIGGLFSDGGAVTAPVAAAGGGYIRGPGTSTSDSIPARLSDGEYVVRAAAVDRYGVGLLEAINQMRLRPGFAAGGLVAAAMPRRPQPVARFADGGLASAPSGGSGGGVRIINVLDPSVVTSAMQSSEGERVILNTISSNPDVVRSAVGQ